MVDMTENSAQVVAMKPRKRTQAKDNDAYADFMRRAIRAYGRRVGDGDVEALKTMVSMSDALDDAIAQAVFGLRAFGYSWTEIADRLGTSRQATRQRWAKRVEAMGLDASDDEPKEDDLGE